MKRGTFFTFLLLSLIIPVVSAIEISLSKQTYYPQETLQAEITGNFVTLKNENILIYREGIPRPLPIISDLTKQNNIYYFYAVLPTKTGNYTIRIENSEYLKEGRIETEEIIKKFEVKKLMAKINQTQRILSINPGFMLTSEDEFEVKIKALDSNQDIITELEGTEETRTLFLIKGIEKTLTFSIPQTDSKKLNLKINDYNIPVFLIRKDKSKIKNNKLIFTPEKLEATLTSNNKYSFNLLIKNSADKNLTNLKLSANLTPETEITIIPEKINTLNINQLAFINISITLPKKIKNNITGQLIIEADDIDEQSIPIFLKITQNQEEVNLRGTSITETLSCDKQNGKICKTNEDCVGEITASLEGSCCIGECIEIKESNYTIGIIILIVVVILIFLIWRFKKKQKLKSPQEILKEKSEQFKERMQLKEEKPPEVAGKLEKI